MSSDNGLHLKQDQVVRAVADEASLRHQLREHLSVCPQCRGEKDRLEESLSRLGQMAERFSPLSRRRVSLPAGKARTSFRWSWEWRAAFGVAVAVVFVMFVVGGAALFRSIHQGRVGQQAQELWEPDPVMTEISRLSKNALPRAYLDISGESDSDLDEEFMQFIVPNTESDPLSYDSGEKGVELC